MHLPIFMLGRQLQSVYRRPAVLMTVIVTLILLLPVRAVQADIGMEQLDSFIKDVETFQADFEQTQYDADSVPLQTSTGTIKLKRPGRFIWSYITPETQEIVADGERIWLYDKDLEQVTVNAIDERIAGTPLVLLMRSAPLEDAFDIVELGAVEAINWLELTPKSDTSDFEQIFIGMNEAGLAAMELRDNFGQATQIRFSDFQAGVKLDNALFEFQVPDGVDVIGLNDY
ncbi:outer membrane lipoprotein chaperone LolA [Granulosicoccus antarcticus]|uniref:Outer-membrane lipoprotein carrier protein n=1 Tax=Granulosicoccus antarcticus IMCC3135 TaxID=1192854 RepID=A0A2Z2P5M7_9GAMM|nr:outer membrane lipoprotein chaperone LolA [Granulosicoccus antarcticus]ASJ75134.1 Outer-membrane lipoprotein carrier protein [Granulosicoccus antarcticus IMCC3135]